MTNARFEDLERRVIKLKLKKYMKILLVFLIVFGLLGYLFVTYFSKEDVAKKPLHVTKVVKPKEKKAKEFEPIKNIVKVEKKVEITKKEPTYDTVKLTLNIPFPNVEKIEEVAAEEKKVVEEKRDVEKEPNKKMEINFKVKEVKSEEALLKRFKVAGDFDSANSLASLYFDKKEFERSIYWSKKASKLDGKEESSWIIYAKSKYALGNKEEAIKSLELYLDYFSSDAIRKLLNIYRSSK